MTFLKLPAQYYKQHDADLTKDIPGRGYDGWTMRMLDVPLARTALVSMHVCDGWGMCVQQFVRQRQQWKTVRRVQTNAPKKWHFGAWL